MSRIGGSFAPPITPVKMEAYKTLFDIAEPAVKEVGTKLLNMVEVFNQTPRSSLEGSKHPVKGMITPLEEAEIKRIWDYVPWDWEIAAYNLLFDKIPSSGASKPLRDAAFHLLWFATELEKNREPITNDQL